MLTDMSNFLEFIASSAMDFVRHLPAFVSEAQELTTYLPTFLVPAGVTMISVLIMNKLMHNGVGG